MSSSQPNPNASEHDHPLSPATQPLVKSQEPTSGYRYARVIAASDEERFLKICLHLANELPSLIQKRYPAIVRAPKVNFGYLDHPDLNAGASLYKGEFLVEINTGAIFLIVDLFYRMMSHPKFLRVVGDPSKETVRDFHSIGLRTNYNDMIQTRGNASLEFVAPQDPVRRRYAGVLAIDAIRELLLHELGHLYGGHCDYLATTLGIKSFFEMQNPIDLSKNDLLFQALEIDADSFAANFGMMVNIHASRTEPIRGARIVEWLFLSQTLYCMFGAEMNKTKGTHPPAPIRRMALTAVADVVMHKERDSELTGKWERMKKDAHRVLSEGLYCINGEKNFPEFELAANEIQKDEYQKYLAILLDRHHQLYDELVSYRYTRS